ncbi:hypothetical protein [Aquiflexum sp.]|uniref:hypothetical protein n=1 Tax=Aquiflexum sp. TaxID=1872584 RepID=UPI003593B8F0
MKNLKKYLSAIIIILLACNEAEESIGFWENHKPFTTDYSIGDMERIDFFSLEAESRGESNIREASGLAYSRKNPGYLWTHQDKNNDNRIFLLDVNSGETVAAYRIKGTKNRDWEDIETAPGPVDGIDYLYVGEVGDNDQKYGNYSIYRFEEPTFEESHRGKVIDLEIPFDEIKFQYPNKIHDTEALMVDPKTKDIYLATKRDLRSMLFVLPYPQNVNEKMKAIHAGTFSFRIATAGTVSKDGNEVLIKNYDRIFYWKRNDNESFIDMIQRVPALAPYNPAEAQGEAVCFDHQGGYFTLSEFSNSIVPELFYYKRFY